MRTWLQHYFHPVSLWSRLGGQYKTLFELYERYLWQPFLRGWLNGKDVTESQPICEIKTKIESKPSHSTEEKTKLSNPENAVSEQSRITEVPIYPDWTPFNFGGH
jgi:hypothetical protein